jgi:hypothetical protein
MRETLGIGIWIRAHENGVDHAEDGGGSAYA